MKDKHLLIDSVVTKLRSKLTAADSDTVRSVLLEVLSGYDVTKKDNMENPVLASQDLLEMYLDAKAIEGRSQKTIARYRYILNQFFHYENVSAIEVTVFHIRDYFSKEKRRGIADSTIAGKRDVFNSFYGWLFNEGIIQKNPCKNIGSVHVEKKVRLPFTAAEVDRLRGACKTVRNRAIVEFLRSTGCRVSEMCELDRSNVDYQNGECIVRGKGNKQRTVFVDDVALMWLRKYVSEENEECKSPALFVGKGGKRLQKGGVELMLKNLGKECGVSNVHPHRFRRTLATNLINRGMAIQQVAAVLGHDMIETTMTYVYQSKEGIKNEYKKYTA